MDGEIGKKQTYHKMHNGGKYIVYVAWMKEALHYDYALTTVSLTMLMMLHTCIKGLLVHLR